MKTNISIAQLFLRLALGIGFILPVMDRFGWLGAPGQNGVAWGNWDNFVAYTNTLVPFASKGVANIMGAIATAGEGIFAILLIIGYKTKLAALGSFLLTLTFALCMALFYEWRAPFSYSVFTCSAAKLVTGRCGYL
jgi:putative oxidoreductase